jgi:anti-sigma regulatory factor (Ser/Thr protein kinase)
VDGSRAGFPAGCELAVFRLRSGRRLGRDVAVMARGPVRESVTIAGRPERVAVARAFATAVLGQHPAGETAVLLLSELVTNSVRHSASGLPGRTVTVTVLSAGEVIRAEVADRSGVTVPALRPGGSGLEGGGRGLYLVDCLAARWGFEQVGRPTTTWFELQHR